MNKGSILLAVILSVASGVVFSKDLEVKDISREAVDQVEELLFVNDIQPETGFGYIARLTGERTGDQDEPRSDCVLLEDGNPLPGPRALHADIRNKGKGNYSHWTKSSLYFSASDNSDPRTNGRKYVLWSQQKVKLHRTVVKAEKAVNYYKISAPEDRLISNRRLIIRNLDSETTVVPRLALKGWPDLSSSEGILKSVLKPEMSAEEKTLAIWKFLVDWRYHYYPAEIGHEIHDPVKFINVYGYGFCDDSAQNAAALASLAGLRSRLWGLEGHVVAETFYNSRWHMIDPDHEAYYRMPKGHIASVEELAAHPEVIQKTERDPIGSDTRSIADLYSTTHNNKISEKRRAAPSHRLDPRFEPGDELIFDLQDQSAYHALHFAGQGKPPSFANGELIRKVSMQSGGEPIHFHWPYAILGGQLRWPSEVSEGKISVSISRNGKSYKKLTNKIDREYTFVVFDEWAAAGRYAIYEYWLRLEFPKGERRVIPAELNTKFQFAPRALAQVQEGGSQFELFIKTPDGSKLPADWKGLELRHEWQETVD